MGAFRKLLNFFVRSPTRDVMRHELVIERGNGFYGWNGKMYQSDIIRSCIRPFARAIGKLEPKQIRDAGDGSGLKVNPDRYIRALLSEPNPYMTGRVMLSKLAVQLALNNNAFALIVRDPFGYAEQIYPIPATAVEALYDESMNLWLRFSLRSGAQASWPYSDIIHIREDFGDNDVFGDNNIETLRPVMDVVGSIDKSIIDAVKNGGVVRWLLKWKQTLRPEDIKTQTEAFVKSYLTVSDSEDSIGAAGVDAKMDAEQITPHDYVPNAVQWDRSVKRVYDYFNSNEKIISSTYTEDEWNAYYESVIEPVLIQLGDEFTRKIFSRRERGYGNRIVFESMSLAYASMATKLNLLQMVDRGAMTPNEWRLVLNMAPIEGGDKPIRRLDTAVVKNNPDKGGSE